MIPLLIFGSMFVLTVQMLVSFAFFASSIREREKRASILGGIQFALMLVFLVFFFLLMSIDFFTTSWGFTLLIVINAYGAGLYFILIKRLGKNTDAIKGTGGLIVDAVKRFDERKTVFSRGRLQPPNMWAITIFSWYLRP